MVVEETRDKEKQQGQDYSQRMFTANGGWPASGFFNEGRLSMAEDDEGHNMRELKVEWQSWSYEILGLVEVNEGERKNGLEDEDEILFFC